MTEVSALPDASIPLAGDELVAILQAATGKKLTLALLADYISEQGGGGLPGVYLLSQFGGVPDLDPATGTGTNSITALRDCFQAMHEAGGGMLFIDGMYRLEGDLLLPYDTDGVGPIQDARDFTIFGLAPRLCGSAQRPPEGGSVLCWTDGGDQAARIVGLGSGGLLMRDFTLWSKEGTTAGNGRPFIHTGAMVLKADRVSAWTDKRGAQCDDDFWQAGGRNETFQMTADSAFQGYSSCVQNCYFNGIRRGLFGQVFFNANVFQNNTFWLGCGSNLAVGARAPIEIDALGSTQFSTSNVIDKNLVEIRHHYDFGIILRRAAQTQVRGNDFYDAEEQFEAGVYVEQSCVSTYIQPSQCHGGTPYVKAENDDFTKIFFLGVNPGDPARIPQIITTGPGVSPEFYRNEFHAAVFKGTQGGALTCQPAIPSSNNAIVFRVTRNANEANNPGIDVFNIRNAGRVEIAGSQGSILFVGGGTISNHNNFTIEFDKPVELPVYTVATLPVLSATYNGSKAYASDGRKAKFDGTTWTLEGAGAGTGCEVILSGGAWISTQTGNPVQA